MGDGVTRVARIAMPDGTPVWARISGAEELARPSGGLSYTDTGFAERVEAHVESLHAVITSVAHSLAGPLRAVRPDAVSVEFGIELTAKAGKVVGLLADGEAKGGIKVTLTWQGGPPEDVTGPHGSAGGSTSAATGAAPHGNAPPAGHAPSTPAPGAGVPAQGAPPGAPAHGGTGPSAAGGGA